LPKEAGMIKAIISDEHNAGNQFGTHPNFSRIDLNHTKKERKRK
jgi:hypothetical protein